MLQDLPSFTPKNMEPLLNAASNEDSLVHSSIVTLPFELLLSIASNLPKAERVKLSSTCKRFRSLFFNGIFRGLTIPPSNRKEVAKHKVEGTEKPQEYQSIPDIQLIKSIQETVHSLSVNDLGNEPETALDTMIGWLHLFPNLQELSWRFPRGSIDRFVECYSVIRKLRHLKRLTIHIFFSPSAIANASWIDPPLCRLEYLFAPSVVVQDHLHYANMTGEHSIRQIVIEDSSTLVVCGDLTPILSLQSLEITELLWIDGVALRKLLSGLPNLRILSISSYEILGINEIDETFPSLPLVRLRGSLPTIGSLAPSSISTLQSLCIDLSGADELGDIFEDERPIGIPATLAQYRQLRNLHFTFEPCKWSSVNHFLISVPYKELHLSSFHITMEWSDYYSSFPGTLNKLANLLRWKLPTSCSLILDMPLKSLINLNVLMEGTLDAFLSSVKEIFRTDIRPWALRPEELPLREIRITGNSSLQMEFYCIASGREWCLLVEGTQPKVREELARLGQPQLRHFSLSRDS